MDELIPLWVGMGVDNLSVSVPSIPRVRRTISQCGAVACRRLGHCGDHRQHELHRPQGGGPEDSRQLGMEDLGVVQAVTDRPISQKGIVLLGNVQIGDVLAVDFFSIGTNDLTQYLLAADRNNAKVAGLNSYFQPALLHMVDHITTISSPPPSRSS